MAKGKALWTTLLVVAGVGGLVHLLAPLGVDVLSFFGTWANWVQGIVGLGTLVYVIRQFMK